MSIRSNLAWRGAVVVLVALVGASAFGCRRHVVVEDGRGMRYQRNLIRYAVRDTDCPAAQLTPMQIGAQPDVYTVTGCTFPVEYWLQCGRGRHCRWQRVPTLNEQAAASLACQPQLIQQQLTQAPNVRIAAGCGRQATFQIACNGAACGWALASGIQGGAAAPPPSYGGTAVQPTAQPAAAPPETAALQAQLSAHREAIMSCIDQPGVNLTIRWTAQGLVQIALPPELAGSAAEGCVQAALGTLRIAATQAGQVTIPVQ